MLIYAVGAVVVLSGINLLGVRLASGSRTC